jgi:valyl-tRNA synthetase
VITTVRDTRNRNQIKPKEVIRLQVQTSSNETYISFQDILSKQINAGVITYGAEAAENSISIVLGKDKLFIGTDQPLDTTAQKQDLLKELDYLKGFIISVEKKLLNERFVQNAKPEVVELERKKKADAEAKIKVIEESLSEGSEAGLSEWGF